MCDLLWSDPSPMPGRHPSKRGTGFEFGPDVTARFLAANNLDYVIRSHEVSIPVRRWAALLMYYRQPMTGQARRLRDSSRWQVHHHLLRPQLLVIIF